jgi:hypothetical protein
MLAATAGECVHFVIIPAASAAARRCNTTTRIKGSGASFKALMRMSRLFLLGSLLPLCKTRV